MVGLKRLVLGLVLFGAYVGVVSAGTGPIAEILGALLLGGAVAVATWGLLSYVRVSGLPRRRRGRRARTAASPRPLVVHSLRSRKYPSHVESEGGRSSRPDANSSGGREGAAPGAKVPQRVYEAAVLLGVQVSDSPEVIDRAYKRWVKTLHPDRNPSPGDATQQMQRINDARDLLLEYSRNRGLR